jgi:hypothetical protein
MKRIFLAASIIAIGGFAFAAYHCWGFVIPVTKPIGGKVEGKSKRIVGQIESRDSIPSNYRTYTNDKYGFSFQYPDSWIIADKEAEIPSLSGAIAAVEIYFTDSTEHTVLLVAYHLAPNGSNLFKYNLAQYQSKKGWYKNNAGSKTSFAGVVAIQATDTLSRNGKGERIKPALKSVIVDFLDKEQTGTFELQFKTPLPIAQREESKFKHLLSTFSFFK